MLPANRRIKRSEFIEILKVGNRYHSPHLLLYVLSMKAETTTKFSFSVSKKVLKLASKRNKLRRQGYSVILKNKAIVSEGFKCFFVFKKGIDNLPFKTLELEIITLLQSSGVLL